MASSNKVQHLFHREHTQQHQHECGEHRIRISSPAKPEKAIRLEGRAMSTDNFFPALLRKGNNVVKMADSGGVKARKNLRNGNIGKVRMNGGGKHKEASEIRNNGVVAHSHSYEEPREGEKMAVPLAPTEEMTSTESNGVAHKQVYKLVLTGGPCGGKTTGQERLATWFEQYGWKVFTVPETASILLNGRVRFDELGPAQAYQFQKDLLLTLCQIEQVYFNQARMITDRNVLIICDRGALDPSAYMPKEEWAKLLRETHHEIFDLRDSRYNQIVHMVTSADGAPQYYTCANNAARKESMEQALKQDRRTREAWIGHQCLSIVDNTDCRNFDEKIMKLIKVVAERLGMGQDRLGKNSKKRKWLVQEVDELQFGANKFEEFTVLHDYLLNTDNNTNQVRLRSRTQNGRHTYTLTTRRYEGPDGTRLPEPVETRKQLTRREYNQYLNMRDNSRAQMRKKRRCFVYGNMYFHLDTYIEPLPQACNGRPLTILETYTTRPVGDPEPKLPHFMRVDREITGESAYSMYNLAASRSAHQQHCNGNGLTAGHHDQQQNGKKQ